MKKSLESIKGTMIISIASGKGGTGKTTIAVNLALSLDNVQLLDCDVEEPNAHLFLRPEITRSEPVRVLVPRINESLCTFCGRCRQVCAYNALAVIKPTDGGSGSVLVFDHLCHGCGACALLCPEKAITETGREIGVIETGEAKHILFGRGKLSVGEAMAPPVIRELRRRADLSKTVILDAPPGTSCPVVTSLRGSDCCIMVTEPTPFGLNDLMLAAEVVRKLAIPFGVVINRSDIGDDKTDDYCKREEIPVLLRIPFERDIAVLYSKGIPFTEAYPQYKDRFRELYQQISRIAGKK